MRFRSPAHARRGASTSTRAAGASTALSPIAPNPAFTAFAAFAALWLLTVSAGGCKENSKSPPAPAPDATSASPATAPGATPQSVVQRAPAPPPTSVAASPTPAPSPSAAAGDTAGAPPQAGVGGAAADAVASPEAPDVTEQSAGDTGPKPSEDLCAKACAHALKLSLAELPKDARPGVRKSLERALKADCPQQCRERATPASATCVLHAKTARALADCPH